MKELSKFKEKRILHLPNIIEKTIKYFYHDEERFFLVFTDNTFLALKGQYHCDYRTYEVDVKLDLYDYKLMNLITEEEYEIYKQKQLKYDEASRKRWERRQFQQLLEKNPNWAKDCVVTSKKE